VGLAITGHDETASILHRYNPLVLQLKGQVLFTKSWHDLEL
jgi:hypothetical protein